MTFNLLDRRDRKQKRLRTFPLAQVSQTNLSSGVLLRFTYCHDVTLFFAWPYMHAIQATNFIQLFYISCL